MDHQSYQRDDSTWKVDGTVLTGESGVQVLGDPPQVQSQHDPDFWEWAGEIARDFDARNSPEPLQDDTESFTLEIESSPVTAGARKLNANWSVTLEKAIADMHRIFDP